MAFHLPITSLLIRCWFKFDLFVDQLCLLLQMRTAFKCEHRTTWTAAIIEAMSLESILDTWEGSGQLTLSKYGKCRNGNWRKSDRKVWKPRTSVPELLLFTFRGSWPRASGKGEFTFPSKVHFSVMSTFSVYPQCKLALIIDYLLASNTLYSVLFECCLCDGDTSHARNGYTLTIIVFSTNKEDNQYLLSLLRESHLQW